MVSQNMTSKTIKQVIIKATSIYQASNDPDPVIIIWF